MTIDVDRRRTELVALRQSLLAAAHDITLDGEEQGELNSAAGDQHLADHATELVDRELGVSLEENSERLVEEIDAALARLDDGSYGQCARCGQPIGDERLDAVPYATLCISCKQLEERE
mgnify:CR=1 FL=1